MYSESEFPSRLHSAARMKRRENKRNEAEIALLKNFESQSEGNKTENRHIMQRNLSNVKSVSSDNRGETIDGRKEVRKEKHFPEISKSSTLRKKTKFFQDTENVSPDKEPIHRRFSRATPMKHPLQEKYAVAIERSLRSMEMYRDRFSDSSYESYESSSPRPSSSHTELLSNYSDSLKSREKFLILCSLLPDEILRDPVSMGIRKYQTALLFPDVSGFTQLCQKYDKTGMGGPSRLTTVLNGYIGSMIKIVLSRNGDVYKFGGDAFLCTWKASEEFTMTEVVHLALESAIDIQKNCGEHKTDVGVKLRVKIAVAAGEATYSIVGSNARKHYIIAGRPVLEVRDAEQLCRPGDVIVTPSAWHYVTDYMMYSYTYHSDNKHIKVHDFGPLWRSAKSDGNVNKKASGVVRPFLKSTFSIRMGDIQPFILPPVMKSIDLDRSLDHLTEMRQVAIVFFNVILDFLETPVEEVVSLSNQVFQIISSRVARAGGGTNKLTLFDKDMAILTVFGLKGFKHELASQVALKCAYSCLEQLNKLNVTSASAGVTTGMVYCGVIGHPQRKEYTVMGHPVNMSARLMCTYQNMVSCDRNTFLNSKLESGHFQLLEVEYMKGIPNAGPFYKFNISPKKSKLKLDHEAQPILGREKEMQKFENFLRRGSTGESKINVFIIFGTARIGKSRLVAKLINSVQTASNTEAVDTKSPNFKSGWRDIHIIVLTESDYKASYSTIRLIFQPLLGFSDSLTVQEKEDKIVSKLEESKDLHLLAAFNQVFNVNFDMTPQYLALGEKEQINAQMTWIRTLYNNCFQRGDKCLFVIDDAEFIDENSWPFLLWCSLESQKALFLMTIGQKQAMSDTALNYLEKLRAKRITLTELEKWFYMGLACQILGVRAIPVELENMLQEYKSSGNPGWLESFLLSLIQSGSIYIGQASYTKFKTLDLVAPPEFMLSNEATDIKARNNSYWVDCLETFESTTTFDRDNIRVCFLGPNFRKVNESVGDLTMDVMFIKTIDGLNPLEQLVLKAGSVVGNGVRRKALIFVLSKEITVEYRPLAKAVKNLFELKIFVCGKGDMTQKNILISRKIIDSSIRNETSCECLGIKIPDSCKDLPKYASCGFMQFRFSTFRETVYNLLLDDQKKNFHYSCIEYLRDNAFKCASCKNAPFTNVFGYKEGNQVVLACAKTPMHGIRSTILDPKSNTLTSKKRRFMLYFWRRRNSTTGSDILNSEGDTGILSLSDTHCQCTQILTSLYPLLLGHAIGSGRKDIMLEIQFESASLNLFACNIPLTMQILEDALVLVNEMKESKDYPEFCTPFVYSKIYTLMGATKLRMGRLDEALELLKTGLKYLKKNYCSRTCWVKLLIIKNFINLKAATELFRERLLGRASNKTAHVTDLLSECLGLMSLTYMYMKNRLLAKNTSLWSLNKALESNRNLYVLCSAYSTLIEVSYYRRDLRACANIEGYAIDLCKKCNILTVELYELEALGRLCRIIFQTRHVRAEMEEAVHIGFQSINIASFLHSTDLKLDLIPDLIFALVQLDRLSEAVMLMQELEYISRLDSDKSSRLWYYSICLDFQLYTGFTIESFETCENFVKTEEDLALVRDPFAKHRLYVSIWLWCVRHHEWELIKSYGNILKGSELFKEQETPYNVYVRLQRLEGLLISSVHKMEARKIQSINAIFTEVNTLMARLKKDMKMMKMFRARFFLMKAYYRQIRYRDENHFRTLSRALVQAEKIKDRNTTHWIKHLKMLWGNAISTIERDNWIDHSRKNLIEWHESDESKKIIMYSLPLPKF